MKKMTITDWIVLTVGIFLFGLTSLNLYLGRTDFIERGWVNLGLGLMAMIYGGRKLANK